MLLRALFFTVFRAPSFIIPWVYTFLSERKRLSEIKNCNPECIDAKDVFISFIKRWKRLPVIVSSLTLINMSVLGYFNLQWTKMTIVALMKWIKNNRETLNLIHHI